MDRDMCFLVSFIDSLKAYLTSLGWNVVDEPSSDLDAVYVTEGFPETKVVGNVVGVSYNSISDPVPVELGNSNLIKVSRTILISALGQKDSLANQLASNAKTFVDKTSLFPFYDENNEEIGKAWLFNSRAQRVFSTMTNEWRKYWWTVMFDADDVYEV